MNPLFEKLAAAEKEFFGTEFFSPVLKGQPVRVRIAGIVVDLKVQPDTFEGWGVFASQDQHAAKFVRKPTLSQKQQYFDLFPKFSFVVCSRGQQPRGILANDDNRIKLAGQAVILLPEEVQIFDTIDVRFDNLNFWYEGHSSFRSRKTASLMRDLLSVETDPAKVDVDGMTKEEILAYQIAFDLEIEAKKDRKEERLKKALERGGAVLRSYIERGKTYTVEFTVGSERHKSVVDAETLQVSSAGICLSGGDRAFDLQSLVGVIKEGQRRHLINRVGIRNY